MISDLETWTIARVGYLYFERERLDASETIFFGLVTLQPRHAYSWYILALISLRKKQTQQAFGYLQHVLKLDPAFHEARLTLAENLLLGGHTKDARTLLEPLWNADDDHASRRARVLLKRWSA